MGGGGGWGQDEGRTPPLLSMVGAWGYTFERSSTDLKKKKKVGKPWDYVIQSFGSIFLGCQIREVE